MKYNKDTWKKKSNSPSTQRKNLRGPLSPLMTEDAKATANIQDLSYDFACRITRLCQWLNDNLKIGNPDWKNIEIMELQLHRSGTSIGANTRESQHAQSDADFLSKMSIAYKEADETCYWIGLLHDNGYINDLMFTSLDSDMQRILRLLTSITKKVKQKLYDAKKK